MDIQGVLTRHLMLYADQRGRLAEVFRQDELDPELYPVMAYISFTKPGQKRGPHAHKEQTDFFCFPGPGDFRIVLWDNRPESQTYGVRQDLILGESQPGVVIIPPGVVHGYINVSDREGLVLNCPNRLYRGPGRNSAVDEERYEDEPDSRFRLE
ncbi:MAG: dTDP-4-dehydrorhamnose 3,5-epimerase family protein [Deltaproteobacteria bacterium]|nr:dTDP-4-dehydrorhamnose 3,5-epimerase family protein [Deltaproteobacteria bacterium]MBW1953050.1 dTDP-4-dehydrorhamnose 3,5-epimerase family protein [Deltaproteobacteria bacterium]MBW1985926.1 dTDP-4-dehydrorhamnose 3,5-epimerase family protein [Deltaproteobacteria bacterium]MBW2133686.1 dTDP-4-dehydrorhamnose 3,5-epimerase family protein [Deltaproteobacteria bacterium]